MKSMSIAEVKANFSTLAREIERGVTVVVTRHGKPVLEMRPAQRLTVDEAIAGIRRFRKSEGFDVSAPSSSRKERAREHVHKGHKR